VSAAQSAAEYAAFTKQVEAVFTQPQSAAAAIASKFIGLGGHVIFFPRGTKACKENGWQQRATNDLASALQWVSEVGQDANVGIVGKKNGLWALDDDAGLLDEYIQKYGPINTYTTQTVSGGKHFIFRQNAASWAMGNVSIKDENKAELVSMRIDNRYVVAAGSWAYPHNDTSKPLTQYTAMDPKAPITEAPESLLQFIKDKNAEWKGKASTKSAAAPNGETTVAEGGRNNYLASKAGTMRNAGVSRDSILVELLRINDRDCVPPLGESEVTSIADSYGRYPEGAGRRLTTGSQQPGSPATVQQAIEKPEAFRYKRIGYPKFPSWVLNGTSIYEGFVKPYCAVNERVDYFMWAPTAALMLNYLGNKVSASMKSWKPSLYMILIGNPTHAHKSSSIKDGMTFLEFASALTHYGKEIKNAEGRSIVWEAGSPEGLGTDMQKIDCKNAVLFYDEFSGLVSKAGIEKSSFKSALLKMYESALFSNSVKTKRDQFSHAPHSYTMSLITSDTMEEFPAHWSTFANESQGMDKRFSIFLQPEVMPVRKLAARVSFQEGALVTRKRMDKAVTKGEYKFEDQTQFEAMLGKYDGRVQLRAEKWALYFAIDLGLDVIDEDCVERGIAVAEYEHGVMQYLMLMEASSKLAVIQQNIIRALMSSSSGTLPLHGKRGLNVAIKAHKYDTIELNKAMFGLANNGHIEVKGAGTAASPKVVHLIRGFDIHDASDEESSGE
jgi:hypothetical protein